MGWEESQLSTLPSGLHTKIIQHIIIKPLICMSFLRVKFWGHFDSELPSIKVTECG